ncbi:tetratricopeptide repeat protein [Microbulbifer sp. CAU 1566]|uniref:serine/threonine-protein kinase n=1 Tax=Microbulbifer sp. CAU 1566 TaxID=2933269 RepID=UPI00200384B6|nr:serine/threonine-protein kinase [Microbulbifer sp. CAU 1566]MCK7598715.1 tetratricopeptide repeat protein [Microbulbifer sp. CAU 1566]
MPTNNIRLNVIKDLFDRCCESPANDRSQILQASDASPEEIAEVERLLACHDSADSSGSQTNIIGQQLKTLSQSLPSGQLLGAYAIEEEIGRGGMGIVFRAKRADGNYDQQVAIKIAPSFASSEELKHFHQERQILAKLQHPNIATLLDGGSTNDKRPYLVMEYVEGHPIHEYCRINNLGLRARLRLFAAVCEAVSYAHSHLIIHRDIKPDNVLVTAKGQVKLLDFGIGKALQVDGERTQATALKGMTLAYASPEQIRGERTTTATDVYGLGALLYFLLTEQSPHRFGDNSAEKAIQAICHTTPTAPSRALPDSATFTERRLLRGDLDNISSKALRKEPELRYASASELQRDIERYLRREPVLATPPSFLYRAGRLISRYPAASALALSVFLAVTTGLAASLYLANQLRNERDSLLLARQETERQMLSAQRTADLLTGMFDAASPETAQGRTIHVDELINAATAKTRATLDNEPQIKSTLLSTLAQVKSKTGKYRDAVELQQESLTLLSKIEFPDIHQAAHQRAESLLLLGSFLRMVGEREKARKAFTEASELIRTSPQKTIEATIFYEEGKLASKEGNAEAAINLFKKSQEIWDMQADHGGAKGLLNRHGLADAYFLKGDFHSSAEIGEEVLEQRIKLLGNTHPDTINSYRHLARSYMRTGNWIEARERLEFAFRECEKIFTPDHKIYRDTGAIYARLIRRFGEDQKALEILTLLLKSDAQSIESTSDLLTHRGFTYFKMGNLEKSIEDLKKANDIEGKLYPPDSPNGLITKANLGLALGINGDAKKGIEILNQVLDINIRHYGVDDYGVGAWLLMLAKIHLAEGNFREAWAFVSRARENGDKNFERNHPIVLDTDEVKAKILFATGKYDQALQEYSELTHRYESIFPSDAPILKNLRGEMAKIKARI